MSVAGTATLVPAGLPWRRGGTTTSDGCDCVSVSLPPSATSLTRTGITPHTITFSHSHYLTSPPDTTVHQESSGECPGCVATGNADSSAAGSHDLLSPGMRRVFSYLRASSCTQTGSVIAVHSHCGSCDYHTVCHVTTTLCHVTITHCVQ